MCGITGEIRFSQAQMDARWVSKICEKLIARGPDSGGVYTHNNLSLGHRRLSIIDLSPQGSQPMHLPDLGLVTVFNGEIYNYQEIKRELTQKGHSFFSDSDTEVLSRAYSEWGEDFLHRLKGFFAFAIFNKNTEELFCARDRLGIKPFYFAKTSERFIFSSTLTSLLEVPKVNLDLNPKALHHYMSFHSVVPAPDTLFQGIQKLPPATYIKIDLSGNYKITRYWHPNYNATQKHSDKDWEELITESLKTAVKRRLVADVPVGLFLSGGTDSSLIAAFMHEQLSEEFDTFSVGFQGAGGEEGNEYHYSDLIAKKFQTKHHRIAVSSEELLEQLPYCIDAMSEPMVSHDNIGFYLLARYASKHLKVVQSGQGADEVFAGYNWYPALKASTNMKQDYARVFLDASHQELAEALHPEIYNHDYSGSFLKDYFLNHPSNTPLKSALQIDTHVMLVDDPVKRVDNMTMAHGLEVRTPFLDHELVELLAQMPDHLKLQNEGKYLLKRIARKYVPPEVIDRPKGYFPVPQLKYIEGPFYTFAQEVLNSESAKQRGWFQPQYIEKIMKNPKQHITQLGGSKVWQIVLLEAWLQRNGV